VNLSIEFALPFVKQMMNREAGYDRVEPSQRWQRMVEVVRDNGNGGISGEALAGGFEHRGRKVDRDRLHPPMAIPGDFVLSQRCLN